MSTIGERIRIRREHLGMTQEELACKLGYKSRSSINKIEKDGRELRQNKIDSIAKALDTSPAYIMGWTENPTEQGLFSYMSAKDWGLQPVQWDIPNDNINKKDEKDISKRIAETLSLLQDQQESLMFDGKAMDDTTRQLLAMSLENSLKMGKINAKEKFTPNKYKKD